MPGMKLLAKIQDACGLDNVPNTPPPFTRSQTITSSSKGSRAARRRTFFDYPGDVRIREGVPKHSRRRGRHQHVSYRAELHDKDSLGGLNRHGWQPPGKFPSVVEPQPLRGMAAISVSIALLTSAVRLAHRRRSCRWVPDLCAVDRGAVTLADSGCERRHNRRAGFQ